MITVAPPSGYTWSPLGLLIPDQPERPQRDRPVGIDFFAGAGGFSLGFHQAGFHMIAAVEMDPAAALTYTINLGRPARYGGLRFHFDTDERAADFERRCSVHLGLKGAKGDAMSASADRPEKGKLTRRAGQLVGDGWISGQPEEEQRDAGCEHFWLADIRNLTGEQILDQIGMEVGEVAAIIGGPPCQGFSAAGRRDVMDPRNSLVFEYARIITEIQPRTFVMENVPQIESMVTPEGVPVLDAFALAVAEGGYGEYEALRRALGITGAKAATRSAKKAGRKRRDGSGDIPPVQPTKRVRQAVQAARHDQPDLLSALDEAAEASLS